MDTVWEPASDPAWTPAYALRSGLEHLWEILPGNESYGIATVAVYLQDHHNDSRALTVRPGSHRSGHDQRKVAKLRTESLHPVRGDVVVFDSRLSHRGQDRSQANFKRTLHDHRMVLSFNFGRRNAFSESHARSFAMRNELVLNASLCKGQIGGTCAQQAVLHDMRRNPLSSEAERARTELGRRARRKA